MGILLSLLSGLLNGLGGIGYKVADLGKVNAIQSAAMLSLGGTLFFGIRALLGGEWQHLTWELAGLTLAIGLCQYLGLVLLALGFRLGPLSLLWCSASLQFMPAMLFAWLVYDEPITLCQWLGLIPLTGAIASASLGGNASPSTSSRTRILPFLLILISLPFLFSSVGVGMKFGNYHQVPEQPDAMLRLAGNVFFSLVYLVMLLLNATDLTLRRRWHFSRLGMIGSLLTTVPIGLSFVVQLHIVAAPAALVFALSASMSMFSTAMLSTTSLHEQRTPQWYATLLCSILAVILMANGQT